MMQEREFLTHTQNQNVIWVRTWDLQYAKSRHFYTGLKLEVLGLFFPSLNIVYKRIILLRNLIWCRSFYSNFKIEL